MEKYNFKTSINASFYLSQSLSNKVKKIWIVFHGYGQLGKYFLNKFQAFSSDENLFIAPQALNQFYIKGFNGRVGSTWMTSEDRLDKVEDYLLYLSNLDKLILDFDYQDIEINVLGFSQGGNTMSRFLGQTKLSINKIVFWGSKFAEDVDTSKLIEKFKFSTFYLIYGVNDEFVNSDQINCVKNKFQSDITSPIIIKFIGGHEICTNTFKQVF